MKSRIPDAEIIPNKGVYHDVDSYNEKGLINIWYNKSTTPPIKPAKTNPLGIIIYFRSIKTTGINRVYRNTKAAVSIERPYLEYINSQISPVSNSTKGYLADIGFLQYLHLPFKNMYPRTGIISIADNF